MWNARLDSLAGIKIAGRNIDNLRYADDTTLIAENEEDLNTVAGAGLSPRQRIRIPQATWHGQKKI